MGLRNIRNETISKHLERKEEEEGMAPSSITGMERRPGLAFLVGTKNVSSLPRTMSSLSSGPPPGFLQVPRHPFCVRCLVSLPPLDGRVVETWPSKTFRLCFTQIPVPKSCAGPDCHHARVFWGRLSKYKNVPKKAERSAELFSGASQIVSDISWNGIPSDLRLFVLL